MPEVKNKKLCVNDLRHNEYYGMQEIFDELYAKSKNGEVFTDLMSYILKKENILLAYRNIKTCTGSNTAGTDNLTIKDIGRLTPEEVVDKVRYIPTGSKHGYRPRAVRRVEIPKPNGDMRPLGIPCIWDRLVQQCIKCQYARQNLVNTAMDLGQIGLWSTLLQKLIKSYSWINCILL